MFDDLYRTETDRALGFEAASPRERPPPEPPGAFTGTGTGILSGLQQGALQIGRAAVDVAVKGYRMARVEEPDVGKALDEMARIALEPEPELAKKLGQASKKWDPDPETMGKAAQVVQEFTRLGFKGAGYALTLGLPAGAVAFGTDEAIVEGTKLADKGVDPATAAKAGAVHGALSAVGVALPVAGATKAGSAALVAAGGPGTYMAEQTAIREILKGADYDAIAKTYDPFDLVGLAASIAAPGAFAVAAHALRAGKGAAKVDPGTPAARIDPEIEDAARVSLLDQADLDVVAGRAKAEGKKVDAPLLLEHAQGKADVADRIERGEAIVSREPIVEVRVPDPIEEAAAKSATDEVIAKAAKPAESKPPAGKPWEPEPTPDPPEVAALRERIKAQDFEVRLEDGRTLKASEALAEMDAASKTTDTDAGAFRAAVTCMLG